ncbi:MAG: transglutaminase-like domain-containing protein, partial [Bacteroidota bacterium]
IVEYKIEIRSSYISNVPDWEFQKKIPVKYSEYTTNIPEYQVYNAHFKGYFTPTVTSESRIRKIEYSYVEDVNAILSKGLGTGRVNSTLEFTEKSTKYVLKDLPALKDEDFVNNVKNYTAGVKHELASVQYPNEPSKSFTTDWETIVKGIYENESFGPELNKTGYFEKELDVILNGVTNQEERIAAIFNFVKSRMNWNDMYGYSCNDGVKKAYQEKKGNAAEINLMLTSMLRYARIEANPILISTRSNGVSLFPSRTAFDYVISGVELNNQVVLLDATNKFSLPNVLPIRDLNWFGRIIRKNGSSAQINLMPTFNSKDVVNIMATIGTDGNILGKIRDQYFDYNAFVYRINNHGVAKDSYIEKLEKRHQGLEIQEYEVLNADDLSKPIVENYSFTSTNSVEIIGDKMYVSPFMFFANAENPFKQETREYPVDFVYPSQDKFNISIKIPDGYTVEVLPAGKTISMPDNLANFKYVISNDNNQIQLLFTFDTNQAIIGSENYVALKNFYKEMINKQTEKIVLKKV